MQINDDGEFRDEIDQFLDERKAIIVGALKLMREAGVIATTKGKSRISEVVGDPTKRPSIESYEIYVLCLNRQFQASRRRAWNDLNAAGSWRRIGSFIMECIKGYRSLFFLKLAAVLYQFRLRDIIHVERHEATILELFA